MKTYKTLDSLFQDAGTSQLTAQELLNGRAHVLGEWQSIKLSDDLRKQICQTLSEIYGGITKTKARVYHVLMTERRQHWGLRRTIVSKYGDRPAMLEYIAGQDQTWENREVRKYLAG